VGRGGEAPEPEELLRHLRQRLPDYMLPAAFVPLPALPWTANGKVDRRALPAPERIPVAGAAGGHVPPRDPVEEALAGIWAEVLNRERIGIHDHFFRLGGHSMKAAQVVAKVRKRLAAEVTLQELFDAPTVAELGALIASRGRAEFVAIEPAPEQESYALSHAQKRLWFLTQQLSESSTTYNVLGAYVFAEELDEAVLGRVFARLTARHESLRTCFVSGDGEPRQVIHPESGFRLDVRDLRGDPDREARAREYAQEEARIPFDLERGPLFRARLLFLAERRSVLLFTLHHIISDGWSMQVLFREFFVLYRAFSAGLPDPLEPLRIQYKDCAAWENRHGFERERRYWLEKLAGPLDLIRLPFDFPAKEIYDFSGASDVTLLSEEASRAIEEIAIAHGTTPSNVILSGFVILLWKLTEQPDLALATTTANRNHADLESVVGFFVNALVLRVHVDEEAEFLDVLRQVTANVHEALGAQGYPFDLLVEELKPPRRGNRQPLFNVCYAFQSFDDLSLGDERLDEMRGELSRVADLGERRPTSKFDLTLFVGQRDGRYVLTFEYSTELFLPQSMRGYLEILRRFLETIAAQPELRAA
jgi:acyl carrier protein